MIGLVYPWMSLVKLQSSSSTTTPSVHAHHSMSQLKRSKKKRRLSYGKSASCPEHKPSDDYHLPRGADPPTYRLQRSDPWRTKKLGTMATDPRREECKVDSVNRFISVVGLKADCSLTQICGIPILVRRRSLAEPGPAIQNLQRPAISSHESHLHAIRFRERRNRIAHRDDHAHGSVPFWDRGYLGFLKGNRCLSARRRTGDRQRVQRR